MGLIIFQAVGTQRRCEEHASGGTITCNTAGAGYGVVARLCDFDLAVERIAWAPKIALLPAADSNIVAVWRGGCGGGAIGGHRAHRRQNDGCTLRAVRCGQEVIGARAFAAAFEQAVRLDRHDADFVRGLKLVRLTGRGGCRSGTGPDFVRVKLELFGEARIPDQIAGCDEGNDAGKKGQTFEKSVGTVRRQEFRAIEINHGQAAACGTG